jgi:hypothetical protein
MDLMGTVQFSLICHSPVYILCGCFAHPSEAGTWLTTIQPYDPRQSWPVYNLPFQGFKMGVHLPLIKRLIMRKV